MVGILEQPRMKCIRDLRTFLDDSARVKARLGNNRHDWLTLPAQMVDATLARSLLAGVSNPNVFLGR
jgi:hypothetical protein